MLKQRRLKGVGIYASERETGGVGGVWVEGTNAGRSNSNNK